MSITKIAFFNNKGGVGKTSLVFHLSWMYPELNIRVLAVDLDPQANLSAAFLTEERLEAAWNNDSPATIFQCLNPIIKGTGDIDEPLLEPIDENINLLIGDLRLSRFEDKLSDSWPKCMNRDESAFRSMSSFYRIIEKAAEKSDTDIVLIDLGPNLGAINRAALLAADYVVFPLSPDLFSLMGLKNLGPTLREWREGWKERLEKKPAEDLNLPPETIMRPSGYIILQHSERLDRPVKAYKRWIDRIPAVYSKDVLNEAGNSNQIPSNDKNCLMLLKHYRSLMPMAQEVRKPVFRLKPADGAIGSHTKIVTSSYYDFKNLAKKILSNTK